MPERAQLIRVLMMEINRISSHWVWLATGGMELGALTAMTNGFRARERCLDIFELITGLRMNHAYIRPGGVAQDLPDGADGEDPRLAGRDAQGAGRRRQAAARPDRSGSAGSRTSAGSASRAASRSASPARCCAPPACPGTCARPSRTLGYETFDFEVPTDDRGDCWARFVVRVAEMRESLKIVEQVLDRLEPGPVMVDDPKIAWPAQLSLGPDGMGNSLEHVQKIMDTSMESLIHHFKLVTEGFRVPPGQVYRPSSRRAASSARTSSATAAPGRTGCTSASRPSSTCRPPRRWRWRPDRRRHRLGRLDRPGDGWV